MKTGDNRKSYNIFYDESLKAVVMEWDGYSTSQEFKQGTELMLQTLVDNKASKVFADLKNMILIGMEDQKWLETDFIPRSMESGFKALAIIRPDSYFNRIAVETVSYKVNTGQLVINFFDNVDEAKAWIQSVEIK